MHNVSLPAGERGLKFAHQGIIGDTAGGRSPQGSVD